MLISWKCLCFFSQIPFERIQKKNVFIHYCFDFYVYKYHLMAGVHGRACGCPLRQRSRQVRPHRQGVDLALCHGRHAAAQDFSPWERHGQCLQCLVMQLKKKIKLFFFFFFFFASLLVSTGGFRCASLWWGY